MMSGGDILSLSQTGSAGVFGTPISKCGCKLGARGAPLDTRCWQVRGRKASCADSTKADLWQWLSSRCSPVRVPP